MQAGNATLSVSRTYNSQSTTGGPLGPGWTLSTPDTSAAGQWQSLTPGSGEVEATTTLGQKAMFTETAKGFIAQEAFKTYTLTETSISPVEYRITDSAGDYRPVFKALRCERIHVDGRRPGRWSGRSEPGDLCLEGRQDDGMAGPAPASGINSTTTFLKGCRALVLHYASNTTAKGEGPSEWGRVTGQFASVSFVEGAASKSEYTTIPSPNSPTTRMATCALSGTRAPVSHSYEDDIRIRRIWHRADAARSTAVDLHLRDDRGRCRHRRLLERPDRLSHRRAPQKKKKSPKDSPKRSSARKQQTRKHRS